MSAILHGCLKIVAAICLYDAAPVEEVAGNTTWTGVIVSLGDTRVASDIATDLVLLPDPDAMERRCEQGRCFRYANWCDEDADKLKCRIYWYRDGERELRTIEIESPSRTAMTAALPRIAFAPWPGMAIPFGTLTHDNGNKYPFCYDVRCGAKPGRVNPAGSSRDTSSN